MNFEGSATLRDISYAVRDEDRWAGRLTRGTTSAAEAAMAAALAFSASSYVGREVATL